MNIRDIARIAGVSTSTVSKIVNGKDSSISEETCKKVLTIVKEYHYKPYASASQRTRSYTIGVLLRSPSPSIARWTASSRPPRTPDTQPMPTTAIPIRNASSKTSQRYAAATSTASSGNRPLRTASPMPRNSPKAPHC